MNDDEIRISREFDRKTRKFKNTKITGKNKDKPFFVKYENAIRECFLTESSDVKESDMVKVKFSNSEMTADFFLHELYLTRKELE